MQRLWVSVCLQRNMERAAELTTGLVRDDENHYSQRLILWEEFNTCWLSTLQKQKSFTQDIIATGQRPPPPKTLIDYDFLEKMGTQLVKHCDNMEKHGLVDYQMGVWEEEIVASRCFLPRISVTFTNSIFSVDHLPRSPRGHRRRIFCTAALLNSAKTMITQDLIVRALTCKCSSINAILAW